MKFIVNRQIFENVLSKIQGVCAQHTSLAILGACLIEANVDGYLSILGTDLEISIKAKCEANVLESGSVVLNAKRLYETVKSVRSKEVSLSMEGNRVLLESGQLQAHIISALAEDFPNIASMDIVDSITIESINLINLIDKCYFSISNDESRVDFTGALFTVFPTGRVQMVSTDGHRLSKVESHIDISSTVPEALQRGIIIPRKGLKEIKSVVSEGNIQISLSKEKLLVQCGEVSLLIQLIVGNFPDFTKVIPLKVQHRAIVSKFDFTQMLNRASLYTSLKVGSIRLTLRVGILEIHAFDAEAGEIRDYIQCEYNGSGITAGFNWRYLIDVLKVIDGDMISLEIAETEPCVIRDPSNSNFDFIVMPMQL